MSERSRDESTAGTGVCHEPYTATVAALGADELPVLRVRVIGGDVRQ
jgi:hypothetical protein